MATSTPTIDEAKLEQFMGQFVQDLGAGATEVGVPAWDA
jgi:hypothetical protein